MQKILFITTNNLTTNPRLLKEVILALDNGFAPTVLCFDFDNWTTEIENTHRESLNGVGFVSIPATRLAFGSWLVSSGIHFICRKLSRAFDYSDKLNAYASDKRSFSLIRKLDELTSTYKIVISHNLGALYPAYAYAKKNKIPFAFDIEDYHPGERTSSDNNQEVKRREALMKKLLPHASYISYASPLIGEASLELVPELKNRNHLLINNSFSSTDFFLPPAHAGGKLRIVWFSQNIASGRGLEIVVPVLYKYRDSVELTVIGNIVSSFQKSFLSQFDEFIIYNKPLPQQALHLELANFDLGLAVEVSSADLNKDIAYSNKIFAYAQAGLYILATDTKAQKHFMNQNPSGGMVFEQSELAFEAALKEILIHKEEIIANRSQRFESGKNLAWEKEASKLLSTWKASI
ncbi:hypothetical protein DXT99_12950 [Pontibacter diazotrophicus]|uniref:Glycosyltransferase n=1 Tax=Pontibacter diazotrophicus TaxID=1400979 RepID=A0A3D8LBP4_9BACT|nr:hypothetical protein [Pontibacter diazotrophicus]RDV14861.1 hypothetical protein DXT99_12950 [Pontibacter diazotrophicus]